MLNHEQVGLPQPHCTSASRTAELHRRELVSGGNGAYSGERKCIHATVSCNDNCCAVMWLELTAEDRQGPHAWPGMHSELGWCSFLIGFPWLSWKARRGVSRASWLQGVYVWWLTTQLRGGEGLFPFLKDLTFSFFLIPLLPSPPLLLFSYSKGDMVCASPRAGSGRYNGLELVASHAVPMTSMLPL